ncbi:atp synthase coupling factor b [Anaeramoeba ignava]|uniref:Atp synthase coupling factor b n=1 Tax=Anaeramoeba ignava TaxID=1746090 RepID=A0A9Q0LBM0_ANAIG|nr:atp synthase coupling factor b [Anaeramoeba ignava]
MSFNILKEIKPIFPKSENYKILQQTLEKKSQLIYEKFEYEKLQKSKYKELIFQIDSLFKPEENKNNNKKSKKESKHLRISIERFLHRITNFVLIPFIQNNLIQEWFDIQIKKIALSSFRRRKNHDFSSFLGSLNTSSCSPKLWNSNIIQAAVKFLEDISTEIINFGSFDFINKQKLKQFQFKLSQFLIPQKEIEKKKSNQSRIPSLEEISRRVIENTLFICESDLGEHLPLNIIENIFDEMNLNGIITTSNISNFKQLEVLDFKGNFWLNDNTVSKISSFDRVFELNFTGCSSLTDESLKIICENEMFQKNLEVLILGIWNGKPFHRHESDCQIPLTYYNSTYLHEEWIYLKISEDAFVNLKHLKNLIYLDISGCLGKNNPNLEYIQDHHAGENYQEKIFSEFLPQLNHLQTLILGKDGITAPIVEMIPSSIINLKITISACSNIIKKQHNQNLAHIYSGVRKESRYKMISAFQKLDHLKILSISEIKLSLYTIRSFDNPDQNGYLLDHQFASLLQNWKQLAYLKIEPFDDLVDFEMTRDWIPSFSSQLLSLDLSGNKWINDDILIGLEKESKGLSRLALLRSLDLSKTTISDQILCKILPNLFQLDYLNLQSTRAGNETIKYINEYLRNLTVLKLGGKNSDQIANITDEGIRELALNQSIQKLFLLSFPNVTILTECDCSKSDKESEKCVFFLPIWKNVQELYFNEMRIGGLFKHLQSTHDQTFLHHLIHFDCQGTVECDIYEGNYFHLHKIYSENVENINARVLDPSQYKIDGSCLKKLINLKSFVVSESEGFGGKLYSCGNYEYNGLNQYNYEFTEIKSSLFENDDNILEFSVGYLHTLILTSKGKLIGFGNNNFGELGIEDIEKIQTIPIQIELPKLRFNEDISNYHISCGDSNSFLYYSPFLSSFSNLEEDLIKLFRRKEFCDISFKTENGEIIEAHKLILKYRLNQKNENQIEKLQEIISKKSIKESNQIFEMIYSNRIINPKLYFEIKEIINPNEKIEETIKRIYLNENENEKDFIIERKEKQYKFPKLILIMRSELYRGMFLSVTKNTSNKVTDYSELSNKSFQIFEYWIYSNQIKEGIQITQEIIDKIKILKIN